MKRTRPPRLVLEALEDRTLLSTSIPLNSDSWTPMGPSPLANGTTDYTENTSGRVTAVAAHPTDPNTLYLTAAGGGVWKTTDAGASWTPLTDNQATLFMGAIALAPSNPSVIYAGTGEASMGPSKAAKLRDNIYYGRGVLKSTDGGTTWSLLGSAQFDRRTISKIVVSPTDPNTVYLTVGALATNGLAGNTGVWKSRDGGTTWTNTTTSISTTAAYSDLVMDPTDAQTLYAAIGEPGGSPANGVCKTTDGGSTWAVAGNFPTGAADMTFGRIKLALAPAAPQTLYASIAASGLGGSTTGALVDIYKTTDGGATWAPLSPRPPNYLSSSGDYHSSLIVAPTDANTVYAGGLSLRMTTDGGATWSNIAPGDTTGPHHDHHAIGFDASGRLLDGNDGGLWRLDDPALVTWTNLNTNLQITQFNAIAVHPTSADIAYAGAQDNGTDQFQDSLQWTRLSRGDGGAVAVSASDPNRIYEYVIGSSFYDSHFFRRSLDGGQTWVTKLSGIDLSDPKLFYAPFVIDLSDSNHLVLGTNRVYETTDGANNWSAISAPGTNGWTVSSVIDALAVAPSDRNTVYATAGGHIFVTTNDGATWQQRDVAGVVDHFRSLLVDATNSQIAYAVRDRFGFGHVYRTVNGGQSWTDISGDLPDLPTYSVALDARFTPGVLFVGTDSGVYASNDLGAHWSRYRTGLPSVQVIDLKLNSTLNILAAGTHGRGLWQILVNPPGFTPEAAVDGSDAFAGDSTATGAEVPASKSLTRSHVWAWDFLHGQTASGGALKEFTSAGERLAPEAWRGTPAGAGTGLPGAPAADVSAGPHQRLDDGARLEGAPEPHRPAEQQGAAGRFGRAAPRRPEVPSATVDPTLTPPDT